MTPTDLVALVARLRELAPSAVLVDMGGSGVCHSAAAAIEQLQAELDVATMALKLKPRPYADADLLIEERDAARAELAAAKADSERYRWLKANHLQTGNDSWIRTGEDLEEAVDSARAQAGGK